VPAKEACAAEVDAFMECVREVVGVSRPVALENLLARWRAQGSETRKLYRWAAAPEH
jgi:hypothetical protein